MPRTRHQLGQADDKASPRQVVGDDLRGWIERVIVPILVELYLRKSGWKPEQTDG